nr:hypothetical protein [Tanacetum cinerariifolium]
MEGPDEGGDPEETDDREEIPPHLTKEQIEGHVSALKSLIKSHNRKNKGDPISLDFDTEDTEVQDHNIVKGKEVVDEDLRKPFKEAQRTPLTRRIIECAGPEYKMPNNIKLYCGTTDPENHLSRFASAANLGEWPMPVWFRMFQQTLDGSARGWFKRLPPDSINGWAYLREAFAARFSVRRACFKELHEITKIIRRANESLTAFKERWMMETGFIMGVPKVMKISSFMDSVKSPELAKCFSDKVPTTVNEMMERLDDFVQSEEAYANTELPKGEARESPHKISFPSNEKDVWPLRNTRPRESRRDDYQNRHRVRNAYRVNRPRDDRAPYPPPRGEYNRRVAPILVLASLTKRLKEILAIETQLRLPIPRPMKQLEMALESGKLNHLVKDVRGGGRRPHGRDDPQPAKIINVISVNSVKDKKRKVRETTESWMNIPITFLAISAEDIFEEPLIVEAEVEGYLVRDPNGPGRVHRRSIEATRKDRAGGKPNLKTLRSIPSTIHAMMKFPTPKGVATLVTRMLIIAKCRRLEKKQMVEGELSDMTGVSRRIIGHALNVNPYLDPVCQKRRTFSMEKSRVVTNELAEWVKAGIVRPVKYPTYISNPVLVKKEDETWRMCIDFKNLNSTCPKDYYPLPNIDCKVESVMGFKYKCFLDDYKGYHQIQMAEEGEEKTAVYTDQGTYCYTKMPFGLKNTGATHERLVDSTFQSQIRRNLEAYVDDMHKVKSKEMFLWSGGVKVSRIREIYMRSCGMHMGPRAIVRKASRQGYYWLTMDKDAKKEVKKCDSCQIYAPVSRLSKTLMTSIMAPWPFYQWGMDILRSLPPVWAASGHCHRQRSTIGIPTYRNLMIREEYNEEEMRLNLDLLHERKETTTVMEARYKTKMERYYNRNVRSSGFRPGEFMFQRNEASRVEDQGKLGPKWEGPYRVVEAYENGFYKLQTLEDKEVPRT